MDAWTIGMVVLGAACGASIGAAYLAFRRRRARNGPARAASNDRLQQLPPELAGRYRELVELAKRIRATVKAHGLEPVMASELSKLDFLIGSYLRLAEEAARFRTHLQASPPGAVEKEAERIRERLALAEGETAHLMQQNLAVVEKRIEKLEQIRQAAAQLKSQLDTIEDTVRLIDDQALKASQAEDFTVDVDGVIRGVEAMDAALAETHALVTGSHAR